MSLTRKALQTMGLEEAQIDQIITLHTGVVNEIKDERDKLKADADKLQTVQKELEEAKKTIAKQGDENPFKVKYDALKKDFDKYKEDVTAKETKAKKESAYKQLLKDAGVSEKRINSVIKVSRSNIDELEFDDDGKVKDAENLVKGIKEEWADFIEKKIEKGAKTETPPAGSGEIKTREEIMNIADTQERQAALAEYLANGGNE